MMTATVVLVLKAGNAIVKSNLAGQSTFRQQLQGTVHRRKSDSRIFFPDQPIQLISGEVLAGFKEGSQDVVPLLGVLQANPLKVTVQNFFRLAHHLARNRGLVVNTLLQHGRCQGGVEFGFQDSSPSPILKMNFNFKNLKIRLFLVSPWT